ncbi:hypothetical protein [Streptomyces caatingaensis]|uniref:Uncharacterized protein n=1 Tax=Streptomyces caatingaensis TaxID=1678637 RepID=A0A0K9XGY5_9ACTN|nr:hypothetical protein [Streptomyces caatingaensis]KNB52326.1 hypothetical protein AC230_12360 [Streptomyces caatingaensis]
MDHVTHGCVLLLDGTPDRRRGLLPNPTAHAVAGARPRGFLAAGTADVVQLPAMAGPQSVLVHLRDAATVPGPLLVWVTGHLMVPARKGQEVHLALRESTPATVRYNGLPWEWLLRALREHAGPTLLVVDAEADDRAWPAVAAAAQDGRLTADVPVCGVVTPSPERPLVEAGPYTRAFLTALSVGNPAGGPALDPALVHQLALGQAALPDRALALQRGAAGDVLANPAYARASAAPAVPPEPVAPPPPSASAAGEPVRDAVPLAREEDALPRILAAANAGRHNEAAAMAAAWEQQVLRRHGPQSAEAGLWIEVRADLARLAGDHPRAAELWMSAAANRLARSGPSDREAVAALKRAHYCWQHSGERAPQLAPALLALWEQVPGNPDAAADVRARLAAATG